MNDFLGRQLSVGDKVACTYLKYTNLYYGEVIGFSPKKVRLCIKYNGRDEIITRYYYEVVKIT